MNRWILIFLLLVSTQLSASESYNRVYVFGDSLSDSGNVALLVGDLPDPPFFNNHISNGLTAVEVFAAGLGLTADASLHLIGPAVGTNYAVAGARAAGTSAIDLSTQVVLFLANSGGSAAADSLYVFFIGGNDVRDARDVPDPALADGVIDAAVTAELAQVQALIASGAHDIVVMNVPDIGSIPESGIIAALTGDTTVRERTTRLTRRYNKGLRRQLKKLDRAGAADIEVFNTFKVFNEVIEEAASNGFTNTTDACFSSISFSFNPGCNFGANFPAYIFFDEIHPTARVHAMIGQKLLDDVVAEHEKHRNMVNKP